MPSLEHEVCTRMFHNQPELAPLFLRENFGLDVKYSTAELDTGDLNDIDPTERRSDGVVLLWGEHSEHPVLGVVTEIQRDAKEFELRMRRWAVYAATLADRPSK